MSDILIVDDDEPNSVSLKQVLETQDHQVRIALNSHECFAAVGRQVPYVIILDLWLRQIEWDGMKLLDVLHKNYPSTSIIILSAHADVPITAEAMQNGAFTVLMKPVNPSQMIKTVDRAMDLAALNYANHPFRVAGERFEDLLIGHSRAMSDLVSRIDRIAPLNAHVVISGGVGCGKQVAATYLHAQSSRRGDFAVANFSTIRAEDCDRLLFGRESGRAEIESGLIERARHGTLYLNRLEDMPIASQKRLVAAIANQRFRRDNGTDQVDADFRVIAATRGRVGDLAKDERLSGDLLSRLSMHMIEIPTLEARREDIPDLIEHFLELFRKAHNRPLRSMTPEVLALLKDGSWPGNVSQLKNLIERIVIMGQTDDMIGVEEAQGALNETRYGYARSAADDMFNKPIKHARKQFELEYLTRQIERHDGNVSKAAEFVGMERTALHRKLKQLRQETSLVEDQTTDLTRAGTRHVD